ncbi:MAG TPA: VOC family protein [Acidimicrobiales bacterium]|nr:VOC family protein [Acidimicrobiales bacterium]
MPDPFEQLRAALVRAEPDSTFTARLRARVARALSLPEGVTVSTTMTPAPPALSPYLAVRDARAAIAWYRDVFGAVGRAEPIVMPDGRVGHAELSIAGSVLMLADEYPDIGHVAPSSGGSAVTLHLAVPDVDALVATAVAHGAALTRPPTTADYGRSATIVDPFGHRWLLMAETAPETMPDGLAGAVAGAAAPGVLRPGDLVYTSLHVRDVARAAAFFGSVLGWELEPDGTVGALAPHHALRPSGGEPTLFLCIAVDDVAATVDRVRAAGGRASAPDERPYGIVADCTDDQGMPFAVWQPVSWSSWAGERAGAQGWRQGDLTYVTLEVQDAGRFRRFFSVVAGWRFAPGNVADGWQVPDVAPMCGVHGGHAAAAAVPVYVVDDVAAAARRVQAAGGTAAEPERQPYGVIASCTDDQGARFSLVQY